MAPMKERIMRKNLRRDAQVKAMPLEIKWDPSKLMRLMEAVALIALSLLISA